METTIQVNGMHCEHCVKRVKKTIEGSEKVLSAEVILAENKAVIQHDNADINAVISAINELGFEASL